MRFLLTGRCFFIFLSFFFPSQPSLARQYHLPTASALYYSCTLSHPNYCHNKLVASSDALAFTLECLVSRSLCTRPVLNSAAMMKLSECVLLLPVVWTSYNFSCLHHSYQTSYENGSRYFAAKQARAPMAPHDLLQEVLSGFDNNCSIESCIIDDVFNGYDICFGDKRDSYPDRVRRIGFELVKNARLHVEDESTLVKRKRRFFCAIGTLLSFVTTAAKRS